MIFAKINEVLLISAEGMCYVLVALAFLLMVYVLARPTSECLTPITYKFKTHANVVAACELLADDLINFRVDTKELEITIYNRASLQEDTVEWLTEVSDKIA